MEVLIFAVAGLLSIAVFLILTGLPFLLAERLGLSIGSASGRKHARWLLPLALFLAIATWTIGSYATFRRDCQNIARSIARLAPPVIGSGIAIYGDRSTFAGTSFSWDHAIESGIVQFVDVEGRRRCAGKKAHERNPNFPVVMSCGQHAGTQSALSVYVLPARPATYWWAPPIYEAAIEARDSADGTVIARATDLVFGGGLTGMYLRLFGGDQDYERLSCAYASGQAGPWRPSLVSRPRFAEYQQAGMNLLLSALQSSHAASALSTDTRPAPR